MKKFFSLIAFIVSANSVSYGQSIVDRDYDYFCAARYSNCSYLVQKIDTALSAKLTVKARDLALKGSYKEALPFLDTAILHRKTYTLAYANRAYIRAAAGLYKESIIDFNAAITKFPSDTNLYFFRAKAHFFVNQPKNLELAIADYDLVLKFSPNNQNAIIGKAETYARMKDFVNSIKMYDIAIKTQDSSTNLYNMRGKDYYLSGNFIAAEANFTKAIELIHIDPTAEAYEIYNNRGNNYLEKKEYNKAIEDFNTAISIDANNFRAYSNKGIAKTLLKNYLGAFEDYSICIEKSPTNFQSWYNRGVLRLNEMSDPKGALDDFSHALRLSPQNGAIFYFRGMAYTALKNKTSACDDFFRAVHFGYVGDGNILKQHNCK